MVELEQDRGRLALTLFFTVLRLPGQFAWPLVEDSSGQPVQWGGVEDTRGLTRHPATPDQATQHTNSNNEATSDVNLHQESRNTR